MLSVLGMNSSVENLKFGLTEKELPLRVDFSSERFNEEWLRRAENSPMAKQAKGEKVEVEQYELLTETEN